MISSKKLAIEKLRERTSRFFAFLFPDRTSLIIFLLAFSLLITFWQVGLLLNDEWISANQLTNLKNGSLTVETIKYGNARGIYNIGDRPIGAYTHALPFFALFIYYALSAVDHIINLRLFFILLWLLSVIALLYYYRGTKKTRYILAILALLVFAANMILYFCPALYGFWSFLYQPQDFECWGELFAITFLNIIAMSITSLIIYRLFKQIFDNERIGFIAAIIGLIGTSFSFWALTGKDHTLSLLFIMLGIFFYYTYAQSSQNGHNNNNYKYLAFAMIGLSVWVRAEAAVPLFCALFLAEVLYVYRNNTARAQLMNIIKIFAVILISLMPFFINNYLLFGNIFFPPMKASAAVIITGTGKIEETAPFFVQLIEKIEHILESTSKIPTVFVDMCGHYHEIPANFLPFFFHNDNPSHMSIAEVCPILIFALLIPYRLYIVVRGDVRVLLKKENYLPFLFAVYIVAHILIYSAQTNPGAYGIGIKNYRFFQPIYMLLLYFAISTLRDYDVFDKWEQISTTLVCGIVMLTPSLILAASVFGARDYFKLLVLCKILAWLAIVLLAASFVLLLVLKRSESAKRMFAYALGFSLFTSFFWLFIFGFIYGKVPCAGFVLPVMDLLHGLIAYHTGLVFSMEKFSAVIWTVTYI